MHPCWGRGLASLQNDLASHLEDTAIAVLVTTVSHSHDLLQPQSTPTIVSQHFLLSPKILSHILAADACYRGSKEVTGVSKEKLLEPVV